MLTCQHNPGLVEQNHTPTELERVGKQGLSPAYELNGQILLNFAPLTSTTRSPEIFPISDSANIWKKNVINNCALEHFS